MGLDPATHKPKSSDKEEAPSTMLHHMAQWESARLQAEARLAKEYSELARLHPEMVESDQIENESEDHFLRAWKSDAGEAFRRGINCAPISYQMQAAAELRDFVRHYDRSNISGTMNFCSSLPYHQTSGSIPLSSAARLPNSAPIHRFGHLSPTSTLSSGDASIAYHPDFAFSNTNIPLLKEQQELQDISASNLRCLGVEIKEELQEVDAPLRWADTLGMQEHARDDLEIQLGKANDGKNNSCEMVVNSFSSLLEQEEMLMDFCHDDASVATTTRTSSKTQDHQQPSTSSSTSDGDYWSSLMKSMVPSVPHCTSHHHHHAASV